MQNSHMKTFIHYVFSNLGVKVGMLAISGLIIVMIVSVQVDKAREELEKSMVLKQTITCDLIKVSEDGKTAKCFISKENVK